MHREREESPSIVLIHGAYHGAWCWRRVVPILAARGVEPIAIELPLTGFGDDVDCVRALVERHEQVVVCGHSYGGRVASAALEDLTNVTHIVYLSALMLTPGEAATYIAADGDHPRHPFADFDFEYVRDRYYANCSDADAAAAFSRLRAMPAEELRVGDFDHRPWERIPSTYIVCTQDRAISPDRQRRMARLATHRVELDSDHSPFLSDPARLADILSSVTAGVSPDR